MAYCLDEGCVIHFLIDAEFERNRISALKCISDARYVNVAKSFEDAHSYLDLRPPDTSASVKSAFSALESMARLTTSKGNSLSKYMVKEIIKTLLMENARDKIEKQSVSNIVDGLAEIVNAIHPYRHGQSGEELVVPSFTFAVFVLSNAASFLRWLAEIDTPQRG